MTHRLDDRQTGVTVNRVILDVAACSITLELEITKPLTQRFHS